MWGRSPGMGCVGKEEEAEPQSEFPCQGVVCGETHGGPTWESIHVSCVEASIWWREEMKASRPWSFDAEEGLIYHEQSLVECLPSVTSSLLQSQKSNDSKAMGNGMREKTPSTPSLLPTPSHRVTCLACHGLYRKRAINWIWDWSF